MRLSAQLELLARSDFGVWQAYGEPIELLDEPVAWRVDLPDGQMRHARIAVLVDGVRIDSDPRPLPHLLLHNYTITIRPPWIGHPVD